LLTQHFRMRFQYSCFISYRHLESELQVRVVNDLYKALCNELNVQLSCKVYLDEQRLRPGYRFNEALADALCRSVCLIVVFSPTYFDEENTYCTREWLGMLRLQQLRMNLLSAEAQRAMGFIIPIVIRGTKRLPRFIRDQIQYYNFEDFLLCQPEMSKHEGYAKEIKKIADYVADLYDEFQSGPEDPCKECANFRLPSEQEALQWLRNTNGDSALAVPPGFPR
jgi:TIR domain